MNQEVQKNCATIRSIIDQAIDTSNPQEVIGKLSECSNILGLSAHTVGLATHDLHQAEYKSLQTIENDKQHIMKIKLNNATKYERYYLNYAEALNKELHYKIESLRSILSYCKEEMNKIAYQ